MVRGEEDGKVRDWEDKKVEEEEDRRAGDKKDGNVINKEDWKVRVYWEDFCSDFTRLVIIYIFAIHSFFYKNKVYKNAEPQLW